MKQKIEMLVDDEIVRQAKRRAAEKGVSLSAVIQEALEAYLNGSAQDTKERLEAVEWIFAHPMKLTPAQLKAVLESDPWE